MSGDLPMPRPTPRPRLTVCPYCGELTTSSERCGGCGGRFDPLSRQASQNEMGPWQIRSERTPFGPGCSYQRLCLLIEKGKVTADTILRGPSTHQFWMPARRVPGVANRLGMCHSCGGPAEAGDFSCSRCGAHFAVTGDRQHLGLAPHRLLPGSAGSELVAAVLSPTPRAESASDLFEEDFQRSAPIAAGGGMAPRPMWLRIAAGALVLVIVAGVLGWWAGERFGGLPEQGLPVAPGGQSAAGRQASLEAESLDEPREPVIDAGASARMTDSAETVPSVAGETEGAAGPGVTPDAGAVARQRAVERLRSFP